MSPEPASEDGEATPGELERRPRGRRNPLLAAPKRDSAVITETCLCLRDSLAKRESAGSSYVLRIPRDPAWLGASSNACPPRFLVSSRKVAALSTSSFMTVAHVDEFIRTRRGPKPFLSSFGPSAIRYSISRVFNLSRRQKLRQRLEPRPRARAPIFAGNYILN